MRAATLSALKILDRYPQKRYIPGMTCRLFLLAAALLLNSCIFSNIGKRIRQGGEIHTGLDMSTPADGKLYQTPAQRRKSEAYMVATEYTYVWREPFFCTHYLFAPGWPSASKSHFRPTGRQRPVRITCQDGSPLSLLEVVDAIPAAARPAPAKKSGLPGGRLMDSSYPISPTPTWRRVVAAPFDYVVDPVLTFALSSVYMPCVLLWDSWNQTQEIPGPAVIINIPSSPLTE